jgi:hypothetical protein
MQLGSTDSRSLPLLVTIYEVDFVCEGIERWLQITVILSYACNTSNIVAVSLQNHCCLYIFLKYIAAEALLSSYLQTASVMQTILNVQIISNM